MAGFFVAEVVVMVLLLQVHYRFMGKKEQFWSKIVCLLIYLIAVGSAIGSVVAADFGHLTTNYVRATDLLYAISMASWLSLGIAFSVLISKSLFFKLPGWKRYMYLSLFFLLVATTSSVVASEWPNTQPYAGTTDMREDDPADRLQKKLGSADFTYYTAAKQYYLVANQMAQNVAEELQVYDPTNAANRDKMTTDTERLVSAIKSAQSPGVHPTDSWGGIEESLTIYYRLALQGTDIMQSKIKDKNNIFQGLLMTQSNLREAEKTIKKMEE